MIPTATDSIVMIFNSVQFKFDVCALNKDVIENDGSLIVTSSDKTNGCFSAGCSNGAERGNFIFKMNKFERGSGIRITNNQISIFVNGRMNIFILIGKKLLCF